MSRGIEIAAVSGTYNMIHPDPRCVKLASIDYKYWQQSVTRWGRR